AQPEPGAPDDAAGAPRQQIEEITVVGRQTTRTLRLEVQAAKETIYDLFNSLSDDGEFHIHCRDSAATGTRITQRICRPQFADTATDRAADRLLNGVLFECPPIDNPRWEACFNRMIGGAQTQVFQVPAQEQRLAAEIQRLARENADFRQAIAEYLAAERRYQDARRAEGPASRVSVSIIDTTADPGSTRAGRQSAISAPRPVSLATPAPPSSGTIGDAAREGWVKVRYSVRADGTTSDVRAVDALPSGRDPLSAIEAASAGTFEPAA